MQFKLSYLSFNWTKFSLPNTFRGVLNTNSRNIYSYSGGWDQFQPNIGCEEAMVPPGGVVLGLLHDQSLLFSSSWRLSFRGNETLKKEGRVSFPSVLVHHVLCVQTTHSVTTSKTNRFVTRRPFWRFTDESPNTYYFPVSRLVLHCPVFQGGPCPVGKGPYVDINIELKTSPSVVTAHTNVCHSKEGNVFSNAWYSLRKKVPILPFKSVSDLKDFAFKFHWNIFRTFSFQNYP